MISTELSIPVKEYKKRLRVLKKKMIESKIDVLIVDQTEHIGYFTGYVPTAAMYQTCIVPVDGDPLIILRALDEAAFLEQSPYRSYVMFNDWEDSIQVLIDTFKDRGWDKKRVGLELDSHFLLPMRYEAIKAGLSDATICDFSGVMWEMRLKKSPLEIECLRNAGRIADEATLECIKVAEEGVLERSIASAAYDKALHLGADNTRMLLMTSGNRPGAFHGTLGHHQLEKGDVVHLELIPHFCGYTARIMRPIVIGQPSARQKEVAEMIIRFQDEQLGAMKPGAVASDVDRILREQMLHSGLAETYPNATGYTLGYILVPRTSDFTRVFLPNSDWILEEGMVFHMYTGAEGLAFSETVVITQDGHERLTNLDRKLFIK